MDFKDFINKYQKVPVEEFPNSVLDNIPQPMVSIGLVHTCIYPVLNNN